MKTLIQYEWKKIWKGKRTKIVTAITLLLVLFSTISIVLEETAYDKEGRKKSGLEAIALQRQYTEENEGYLTDQKAADYVRQFWKWYHEPGEKVNEEEKDRIFIEKYYYKEFYPKSNIYNYMLSGAAFFDYNPEEFAGESLKELTYDKKSFYVTLQERIENALKKNSFHAYSERQKEFIKVQRQRVAEPYYIGNALGFQALLDNHSCLLVVLLCVCIGVASVFSEEYQTNAVAVILSTKYGKSKIIPAKVIAAFSYTTVLFFGAQAIQAAVIFLSYGAEGWNLNYQMAYSTFPYTMNFLQMYLLETVCLYTAFLGVMSINLLLSVYMKSTFTILALDVVYIILEMLLPLFVPWSLYSEGFVRKVMTLLPVSQVITGAADSTLLYSLGPVILKAAQAEILFYVIVMVVCLPFVKKGFRGHQVRE